MMFIKSITLSSKTSSIVELEQYLEEIVLEKEVCKEKYPDILISLTEAVNNAIIHGNKYDEQKKVQVHCKSNTKGIYFSVVDEGSGFDPNKIPDPTAEEKIECCGGRGVYIINALADKVAYKNNGNTLELYFRNTQ